MQTQSPRFIIYNDGNFLVEGEVFNEVLLLHCNVTKWTHSVLKRMYSVFAEIISSVEKSEFKKVITISPNPKFAKLFGGVTVDAFEENGVKMEVIVWEQG